MKFNLRANPGDYINISGYYYLVYSRLDGFIHAVWPGYRPAPMMRGNPLGSKAKGAIADCSVPCVPVGWGDGGPALVPSTWRLDANSRKIIWV